MGFQQMKNALRKKRKFFAVDPSFCSASCGYPPMPQMAFVSRALIINTARPIMPHRAAPAATLANVLRFSAFSTFAIEVMYEYPSLFSCK